MSLAHEHFVGQTRPRAVPVNIAAFLSFGILCALHLEPMLGSRAVIFFLLFGLLLLASNISRSVQSLWTYWYILLLPVYCVISSLWSNVPSETFRGSVQLGITFAFAIIIANRVPPRAFMRILFVALCLTMLISIGFGRVRGDNGAWLGIFGSKNAFAAFVSIFALTAFATLLDRRANAYERIAAAIGVLISGPLLIAAQSTGAILMLFPGIGVIVGLMVVKRFALSHRQVLFAIAAMAFAVIVFLGALYWQDLLEMVLNSSGKDSSLTGRTDLWAVGLDYIGQNPLFGVGYRGFWVVGFQPAEELWYEFGISTRTGFHFHNLYISNAVEIGLTGLLIQLCIFFGAFLLVLRWSLTSPSPTAALLAGYLATQILASFIEVPVFFQFNVASIIVVIAFVYGRRASRT